MNRQIFYNSVDAVRDGINQKLNYGTPYYARNNTVKNMVTDMDTIPGFPKSFKTKNPTNGIPVEFVDAKDACVAATGKLNANEPKLGNNLKNITEEDLELLLLPVIMI